jgi:iron complex outermembrane recepter protein
MGAACTEPEDAGMTLGHAHRQSLPRTTFGDSMFRTLGVVAALIVANGAWAQTLATPDTAASAPQNATPTAQSITVTGKRYLGEVASGGARIDAAVKDLPLSLTVATDKLIQDLQPRNLVELADQVAGVSQRVGGPGAFSNDYTVRGFSSFSSGAAVNGFRSDGFVQAREPQHFERVEFLKGPASVLYGATGALGGLVNYVTKTPERQAFTKLSLHGGQFSYGRTTLDANLPLGDNAEARLNAAVMRDERLQAFGETRSAFVAPVIRWRPVAGLTLLAEAFYFDGKEGGRESTSRPAVPQSFDIPIRTKLGERDSERRLENTGGRFEAVWALSPSVDLRQGINHAKAVSGGKDDFPVQFGSPSDLFATPTAFNRARDVTEDSNKDLSSQTELRWRFAVGPTKHKALIGVEWLQLTFGPYYFFTQPLAPIDFNAPVYSGPLGVPVFSSEGKSRSKTRALYAQDFIEIGARWKALVGVRYDDVVSTSSFCDGFRSCLNDADPAVNGASPAASERAVSPRAGIVYAPLPGLNLYGSWSKSFNPNPFPDRSGDILPAERGQQIELGVKQTLPDNSLSYTLSVFNLVRTDVPTEDPADPFFQIAVGEQRSRGIELEATWQPTSNAQLTANAAFIDAKVTRDNVITVGSRLPEAPRIEGGLTALLGLAALGSPATEVLLSLYYTGRRDTLARPLVLSIPAATRIDAALFHQFSKALRLQLNVTNLANKRNFDPTNQGVREQSPRRVTVGMNAEF